MALQPYRDITDKMGEPLWWDEVGCPRYAEFHPSLCNNIYAKEVAFLEIACQSCKASYMVAMSISVQDLIFGREVRLLSEQVQDGSIHYGDPPCNKCAAGYTMNCDDLRVVEFWKRDMMEWQRVPELEIELPDAKGSSDDEKP